MTKGDMNQGPEASPHLSVKNVGHVFAGAQGRQSGVRALGGIDLDCTAGEFLSVIGPSGCGKSTLLDIVAGVLAPTEGTVLFEGNEVCGKVPDGIGMVFQEDASFPWLSVWDNVAFGLRYRGYEAAEIRRRVDHAIGFMGLAGFARHTPPQLSGGMRQRVCIARTLVLQPRLILLDEPFAALDQQTRLLMGEELLRLWRETRATVLLITHSLDEATMLADRVGVMSARPGHFIEFLETEWPQDRDSQIFGHPRFGEITARLWSSLRAESLKSMGGNTPPSMPAEPERSGVADRISGFGSSGTDASR
jgi:NitT/TauT family transport system ATP-binding protein